MTVTLDEHTEALVKTALERGTFESPEQAVAHAIGLLAQHEENDWLLRNREAVRAAIEESLVAEARDESFSEEEVILMLQDNGARRRAHAA